MPQPFFGGEQPIRGQGFTRIRELVTLMPGRVRSVTVMVWLPAVANVMLKISCPLLLAKA